MKGKKVKKAPLKKVEEKNVIEQEVIVPTEEKEIVEAKQDPRNFSILMRDTREMKVIRKSEYDSLIHIAL